MNSPKRSDLAFSTLHPTPSTLSSAFSIVEIVVAAAIIVTVVTAAGAAWQIYLKTSNSSTLKSQAAIITEETSEVLRLFRDQSWATYIAPLTSSIPYQLDWNGTGYTITTNQKLVQGKFVRTFVLSSINRDGSDNIVTAPAGSMDANTKKVTISVFLIGATSTPTMQTEMLLHNVYGN